MLSPAWENLCDTFSGRRYCHTITVRIRFASAATTWFRHTMKHARPSSHLWAPTPRRLQMPRKAEPPKHGNAFGGKQYGCGPCKITFKRLQDIIRHVRDIHDPPRQCPLCHYEWTRAYKIKAHLLKTHSDELCPAVTAGVHALRGHDVVKFIDTYELLRSFETPDIVKS
ncbi:hypothetical protein EDB89DRAFT_857067 [Lactarius sanguifluus]|nr:hypothetical protein EDB89DRAFT_857067 [Lactarius sanguifluus]